MEGQQNQERQKMMYESYFYKQQLGALKKEMDKITLTMIDLTNASKTVKSLEMKESLVPIGGNAFIETEIKSEKILVPIGGGYSIKMNKDHAVEEMDKRIESTKKVIEKLKTEYQRIMGKLSALDEQMKVMQ